MEESSLVPHLRAAAEQQREIESLQRELEATVSRADNLRDERASTIHTIAALAVADADAEDEDNAALLGSARGGRAPGCWAPVVCSHAGGEESVATNSTMRGASNLM